MSEQSGREVIVKGKSEADELSAAVKSHCDHCKAMHATVEKYREWLHHKLEQERELLDRLIALESAERPAPAPATGNAAASDRVSVKFGINAVRNNKWSWREFEDYMVQDLAEVRREATALASPAGAGTPEPERVVAECFDCGRQYGDEHGFPDLVLPNDVWAQISPSGDENGLLCPSCICKRLYERGIETTGEFKSGPLAPPIVVCDAQQQSTQGEAG